MIREKEVLEIYALKGSKTAKKVAEEFGVSACAVSRIWNGHLGSKFTGRKASNNRRTSISKETILEINALKDLENGATVAKKFGVSDSTVSRIWNGQQGSEVAGRKSKQASGH